MPVMAPLSRFKSRYGVLLSPLPTEPVANQFSRDQMAHICCLSYLGHQCYPFGTSLKGDGVEESNL
jgi:hypothetical protein